jgi:hypothetical protein
MTTEIKFAKWATLLTAITLCQLNADKTQCIPVDKEHPICLCAGNSCDGYCGGKVVHQMTIEEANKAMGWKK